MPCISKMNFLALVKMPHFKHLFWKWRFVEYFSFVYLCQSTWILTCTANGKTICFDLWTKNALETSRHNRTTLTIRIVLHCTKRQNILQVLTSQHSVDNKCERLVTITTRHGLRRFWHRTMMETTLFPCHEAFQSKPKRPPVKYSPSVSLTHDKVTCKRLQIFW